MWTHIRCLHGRIMAKGIPHRFTGYCENRNDSQFHHRSEATIVWTHRVSERN